MRSVPIRILVRSSSVVKKRSALSPSSFISLSKRSMADNKVQQKFIEDQKSMGRIMKEKGAADAWDVMWQQNITPWDAKKYGSAPALLKLVKQGLIPNGRALVPGCGSGSDIVALASPDRVVEGLELSATAAKIAEKTLQEKQIDPKMARVIVGDFFTLNPPQKYNVIYDYTFMAALPIEWRDKWAAKMWDLLEPEGVLVTLLFPVGEFQGGPPFATRPKIYEDLLLPRGFVCDLSEPVTESFPARQGREHIAIWRKAKSNL